MEEGIRPVAEGGVVAGAAPVAAPGGTTAGVAPAVMPDPSAAAFFDVDNTVVRGASIFVLALGLWRRDFFGVRDIAAMAWKQARFMAVGENLEDVVRIREQALAWVAGHSVDELTLIGEQVYDEAMAGKVWPGTRALAMGHLARGQEVWLVTATPVEVARVIAQRLGLSGALGTVAETVDGVYTGRLVGEPLHGPVKAAAIAALAHDKGLDLSRCAAYSDSANDIPMLSLVGHPCAVNPDATLLEHARAHGWQVVDYRRGRRAARLGLRAAAATALAGALAASAHRRRG
jgi:HAD superfamily hydrolase (TIGR01490 family)